MCAFHPEIVAENTCMRCHRPLCLQDTRRITRSYSGHSFHHGFDSHHHFSSNRSYATYDLCPICHAEVLELEKKQFGMIASTSKMGMNMMLVGLVLFLLFFGFIWYQISAVFPGQGSLLFLIIPIFIVIAFLVFSQAEFKTQKSMLGSFASELDKQRIQAEKDRQMYVAILEDKERETANSPNPFVLRCFQCGNQIYPGDQYCSNCGDPTAEEFRSSNVRK